MQRKFITNLALLIFVNILIKPFWILGIDREVQNMFGATEYGLYYALFNFSFLFYIILDLGITDFNNRNIAQHPQLLSKYLSYIISLKFILTTLYIAFALSIGYLLGYDAYQIKLLLVLCFNQIVVSFIFYLRSNLSGLHLFRTDSLLSVLDRLFMIIICAPFVWGGVTAYSLTIEWFIYIQTISYLLTAFIVLYFVLKHAHFVKLKWNLPFI
ncbi:hypothetical protein JYT51_01030, partial [Candidatus Amoebophilus asiaticus]|nr:hypothetical protein [Candidatus Amoebophilus asiaticus]